MVSGARGFLKREGFLFDKKPEKLDAAFLKLFGPEELEHIQHIWWSIQSGGSPTPLYSMPKTTKQAHTLMSIDAPRYIAGLEWIAKQVESLHPTSLMEVGAGTGILLRYLRENFPHLALKGVDVSDALVGAAPKTPDVGLLAADYLKVPGAPEADLVVCNFGFDLDNFAGSRTPHSSAMIGRSAYCPGCSDDLARQLEKYMAAWRSWGNATAKLLLVGRLGNIGVIRSFVLSAGTVGWGLDANKSTMLVVRELDGERSTYPALVFTDGPTDIKESLLAIEKMHRAAR